ncbi:MAG: acetate--CoA ligase family protein [Myxococcales bacterium]|nr:acetate--CoA ligase family protein [Myxococcales bacterium]
MARLHEYQGKALLREHGIDAPPGVVIRDPEAARTAAEQLGGRVVLKVQAWVTGRKSRGGVVFCDSPDEAAKTAERMLAMRFGNFPVTEVLVESLIDIKDEFFVSLSINDATRAPVLLLDTAGGTGIEERADKVHRLPVDLENGVDRGEVERIVNATEVDPGVRSALVDAIVRVPVIAQQYEAR